MSNNQEKLFEPMDADIDELLEHIDEAADDPRAWPASLAELVDVLADDHVERGKSEDEAFAEARRSVTLIAHYRGGRMFYLPRNDKLRIALRDAHVWRLFTDRGQRLTITDLAVRFNLTDQQVYNIIREQKRLTIKRRQRDLFPE